MLLSGREYSQRNIFIEAPKNNKIWNMQVATKVLTASSESVLLEIKLEWKSVQWKCIATTGNS